MTLRLSAGATERMQVPPTKMERAVGRTSVRSGIIRYARGC